MKTTENVYSFQWSNEYMHSIHLGEDTAMDRRNKITLTLGNEYLQIKIMNRSIVFKYKL